MTSELGVEVDLLTYGEGEDVDIPTFVHTHEESVFFCRFLKPLFGFKLVYDM